MPQTPEHDRPDTEPGDALSSGVSIFIPLIVGLAIIVVGVLACYQLILGKRTEEIMRLRTEANQSLTDASRLLRLREYGRAKAKADETIRQAEEALRLAEEPLWFRSELDVEEFQELPLAYLYRADARTMPIYLGHRSLSEEEAHEALRAAVEDYTACIRIATDAEDLFLAYHGRGKAHAHLGEFEAAEADLTNAIRVKGTEGQAYFERHRVRLALEKSGEAQADRRRARELGFPPVVRNAGTVFGKNADASPVNASVPGR